MPVSTRSQYRTGLFKETMENPCVLQAILSCKSLNDRDIVCLRQVSKDPRFVDVIDHELEKKKRFKQKVKNTINTIRNYLISIEQTRGPENKTRILVQMYDYLCDNKWFVLDTSVSNNFHQMTHQKLFEVIEQYPPFQKDAVRYLGLLFGLKPPKDYYDSKTCRSVHGMYDMHNKFVRMPKLLKF